MFHKTSLRRLILPLLMIGLVVAGCAAPATPVASLPTTSRPLKVPSLPSLVPTIVQSITSKATPVTQPTPAPTKVPTVASTPIPTIAPTVVATTQPTQTFGLLGTAEQVGDLSILPQQVTRIAQSGQNKPKAGSVFMVVTLSLTNTSQTATVQFDPATFFIEDAATHKTYPVVTLKAASNELAAQMLAPGARLNGTLAFEVPQSTTAKLELELSTTSHILYWTIGA